MSYAIIGFGKIGHALAKAFARNGIEVSVATTRDPQSFTTAAAAIGPTIIPKTLADDWVFDITVRNGKLTRIREYIDTQALARASRMDSSGLA